MMKYVAQAYWEGSLKKGKGTLSTHTGTMKRKSLNFFFEEEESANSEELLAATHAGCFTMAVCSHLTKKGFDPNLLNTEAVVTMKGMKIEGIHLSIKGLVKDIAEEEFIAVAKYEEKQCVISKALDIKVSSDARLIF